MRAGWGVRVKAAAVEGCDCSDLLGTNCSGVHGHFAAEAVADCSDGFRVSTAFASLWLRGQKIDVGGGVSFHCVRRERAAQFGDALGTGFGIEFAKGRCLWSAAVAIENIRHENDVALLR